MKRGLDVVVKDLREANEQLKDYPQWRYQSDEVKVEYRALKQRIRQLEAEVKSYQPSLWATE